MKKLLLAAACAALMAFSAGNAAADGLRGRLAVTGRLGITNPADSERNNLAGERVIVSSDAGFIGGGGLLLGVDDNIAVEVDVTRSSYHTGAFGTAGVTNLSVGGQYRFPERQRAVWYGGAGLDVLMPDFKDNYVDTVVGAHVAAGLDYMLTRQVAFNAELKGVEAFSSDVRSFSSGGAKVGEFNPSNISFTVGARIFFN